MKKGTIVAILSIAALTAAISVSSCNKYVLPEISIAPDSLFFSADSQSATILINSNVIWDFSFDNEEDKAPQWLNFDPLYGGDTLQIQKVTVTIQRNESDQPRVIKAGVKSETLNKMLYIHQEAREPLSEQEAKPSAE